VRALLVARAFVPAGAYAARLARAAPLTNGALAGLGAFLVWLPLRLLIWATRSGDQGLVSGHDPVFRPGQLFGFLVISTALGMLGGFLASRRPAHGVSGGGSPPGARQGKGWRAGRAVACRALRRTGPRNVRTPQGAVLGNTQSG